MKTYKIKVTHYFYKNTNKVINDLDTSYLGVSGWDESPTLFATREAAQKLIDEMISGIYMLSHDEYSRPSYEIEED